MKKTLPLRVRFFIAASVSSLVPLLIAVIILLFNLTSNFEDQIASQAMDIATLTASRSDVISAYENPVSKSELQTIAEVIRSNTQAAFVVFLDMNGIRYSHPNPALIGLHFTGGDEGAALKGKSYTSNAVGISGPSIRAFKPIYNTEKQQIGVVAVGFFEPDISLILSKIYKTFYIVIPLALLVIVLLSIVLANSIKKTMFGMEPIEIATLLKERDCMLQSVKEGIIAIDKDLKITVINQAARNLFPPETEFINRNITEIIPNSQLPAVIDSRSSQQDEQLLINEHIVLTNRFPLLINGQVMGAIATFRPLTEVNKIAEELTGVKKIVNALRARSHEFLNKLHVISGLIQLESYEEARKYISDLTVKEQSLISFLIDNIHNSAIAGLLMGKASEAEEKEIKLIIERDSRLYDLPDYFDQHAMVVVLGNLIENAFDSVSDKPFNRHVQVLISQDHEGIRLEVQDNGSGIPETIASNIFVPGFTTKTKGLGFGLFNLKKRVDVAGGSINFLSNESGTTFRIVIPYQMD